MAKVTTHVDMRKVEKDAPVNEHLGPDFPPKEKEAEAG